MMVISDCWFFQHEIPALWSKVDYQWTDFLNTADIFKVSQDKLVINKTYKDSKEITYNGQKIKTEFHKSSFAMQNILPISNEPFFNSKLEYADRFCLFPTGFFMPELNIENAVNEGKLNIEKGKYISVNNNWDKYGNQLYESLNSFNSFKEEIPKEIKYEISQLASGKNNLINIFNYIGERLKDVDNDLELNKWCNCDKAGFESQLNIALLFVLKQAGLKAYPAFISKLPNSGFDKLIIPSNSEVTTMIVVVINDDNDPIFLDMKAYPLPAGLLLKEDLNGDAFIILDKGSYAWLPVKNYINTVTWNKVDLKLTNGKLQAEINVDHSGYTAIEHLEQFNANKDNYLKSQFSKLATNPDLINYQVINTPSSDDYSYKASLKITTDSYIKEIGDSIFIDPFLCFGQKENPFLNETRKYPVEFGYPFDEIYQLTLHTPSGYKIAKLPSSLKLKNSDNTIKLLYAWETNGDELTLIYKFNIKKPKYEVTEYGDIRQIYKTIQEKCKEQLVLTKI